MNFIHFFKFFRKEGNPYQQQLDKERAKLIAPVTQYTEKQHKKRKYFVNYKGFEDYDANPRLIRKGGK